MAQFKESNGSIHITDNNDFPRVVIGSDGSVTVRDSDGESAATLGGNLPDVGPGATGPIGDSSTVPVITIDAKGRVTALTSAAVTGSGGKTIASFGFVGPVAVVAGTSRYLIPAATTIVGVVAAVGTAPTGASLICDVNKNGTTIFTTQANRPTIAISGNNTTTMPTPDVTALATGDYLTVDVDQIGSTVAGSDLVVNIYLSVT